MTNQVTQYITMYSTWAIYIIFGIAVGVFSNILFKTKYNKYILLIDSLIGMVGAFIFGTIEGFSRDRIGFSNYVFAFIGALLAVIVSHLVKRSLKRNKVEVTQEGGLKKSESILNKGLLYGVIAWVINSFIIGLLITVLEYKRLISGVDSFFISEVFRISLTNLFMELVFWLPVIIVSGGIYRKKGIKSALKFIIIVFVIFTVLWGGWWWFII